MNAPPPVADRLRDALAAWRMGNVLLLKRANRIMVR